MIPTIIRSAVLSDDGVYRYHLSRSWSSGEVATWVMLNPSTADAGADDHTLRKCMGYSRLWGFGGCEVLNLYALRSTDPRGLWRVADPVGPDNEAWLQKARGSALVVVAWGNNAEPSRVAQVLPTLGDAMCIGLTRAGQPHHPLRLPYSAKLKPYGGMGA